MIGTSFSINRVATPEKKKLHPVLSRALLDMQHCPLPQLMDSWMDQVSIMDGGVKV